MVEKQSLYWQACSNLELSYPGQLDEEKIAIFQEVLQPFQREGLNGRIYFPDKTVILVVQASPSQEAWKLIIWDEEFEDVALINFPNEPKKSGTFIAIQERRFYEILHTISKIEPDQAVQTFNREASLVEIGYLRQKCNEVLDSENHTTLLSVGTFHLRQSQEPVLQELALQKTPNGYSLILTTNFTSLEKGEDNYTFLYSLAPTGAYLAPSYPEAWIRARDKAYELYPDPWVIMPDQSNPMALARKIYIEGIMECLNPRLLDHAHFQILFRVFESGFRVTK